MIFSILPHSGCTNISCKLRLHDGKIEDLLKQMAATIYGGATDLFSA
jgi:hypothetical protein